MLKLSPTSWSDLSSIGIAVAARTRHITGAVSDIWPGEPSLSGRIESEREVARYQVHRSVDFRRFIYVALSLRVGVLANATLYRVAQRCSRSLVRVGWSVGLLDGAYYNGRKPR